MIYRNRYRVFVPAVLNYNRIPTRALIEVANLNNRHDRALMRSSEFRQKFADAFVDSILRYYGGSKKVGLNSMVDVRARATD